MKNVLFVCVENSCRSQMAEGFAKDLGAGKIEAYSAGSKPSGEVSPLAVAVMKESDIDISKQQSKVFDILPVKTFDYVVTMGCKDSCPFVLAKERIDWQISDPKNKEIDFFRKVRDDIKNKVGELIKNIQEIK